MWIPKIKVWAYTWQQAPLLAEPSHWPLVKDFQLRPWLLPCFLLCFYSSCPTLLLFYEHFWKTVVDTQLGVIGSKLPFVPGVSLSRWRLPQSLYFSGSWNRAGERTKCIKALVTKLGSLSSVPRIHTAEGENQSESCYPAPTHVRVCTPPAHTHTDTTMYEANPSFMLGIHTNVTGVDLGISFFLFLMFLFYVYECLACLYVCALHVCHAYGGRKRVWTRWNWG